MFEKNPLDVLFKGIKKDLALEAIRKQQIRNQVQPIRSSLSTYANPLNWTPGRAVEIIHHSEGSCGVFREYFHKLSPTARRLLPATAGTAADTSELVFGDWWLHPRNSALAQHDDTPAEEAAIVARFYELINEDWEDSE
jgi:hypothetical protein